MKWLVVVICLARYAESGAIRCTPGIDSPCPAEDVEKVPEAPIQLSHDGGKEKTRLEVECQAGSEWDSNCHSCRCSDVGIAECKQKEDCFQEVFAEPLKCKPNTTFSRDCNTCVCLESGLGLCTLDSCRSNVPKKSQLVSGRECATGTHWKSQCNDCVCSSSGYSSCTEKDCGQTSEPILRCAPDSMWNNDCNSCWCTSDGHAMCTRMGCSNEVPPDLIHQNIENVLKKETATKSAKNKTQKVVCVANRMFIKDCNTCWCNEDGTSFFCTRKVCVPELPEEGSDDEKPEELRIIKKECRPDEVFELDCNMCRCNPDGKSFSCTRRACVDQIDEETKNATLIRKARGVAQELPKTCQPGQEFRMDCNKCLCDNEGQDFSCTRNDCNALNGNQGGVRSKRDTSETIPLQCNPGSVFDRDCNVCRCTSDGLHALCTLKRCTPAVSHDNDIDTNLPESDPNFRCNPGEQFKRGCNDCSCSADGKSVFCTLRFCDQDITPPPQL